MNPMSRDPIIVCPNCQSEFALTQSLAAPLIAASRQEMAAEIAKREAQLANRETVLRQEADRLAETRQDIADEIARRLDAEREQLRAEEHRKAQMALTGDLAARDREIKDLHQLVAGQNAKLADAQAAHAALLRKERALDDDRRELELTVEKRVGEVLSEVRMKARTEAEDSLKLKVAEKEETIASMQPSPRGHHRTVWRDAGGFGARAQGHDPSHASTFWPLKPPIRWPPSRVALDFPIAAPALLPKLKRSCV